VGSDLFTIFLLGLTAPGFMLSPAPQAQSEGFKAQNTI
jgi:hypothetical protein